ncbi:MAG TPA: hypothetical protein VIM33_08730 [Gaiellaceae bacterium]
MALSDEELLDFDLKRLGGFKNSPHSLLVEHGDVYRTQLVVARWLDGYRERRVEPSITTDPNDRFEEGVGETLRDIAAHLRQGDFLPGGTLYEDEVKRGPAP